MDRPIRVLFAIGSLNYGGSERQLIGILKHLDRARFTPVLYLVRREGELLPEVPPDVPTYAFWDDYRQPRVYVPGRIHRAEVRHLASVIERERIDVVYDRTCNMTIITGEATRRTAGRRISVIVSDPATDFDDSVPRFRSIRRRMLRRAYQQADRVLAVSEGVRRAAIPHFGLPESRVLTVENFLDLARLERESNESNLIERAPQRFRVVAIGRLHPAKAFDILIEALGELVRTRGRTQLELAIVGSGAEEDALREQVSRLELDAHVLFAGYQEDIGSWLRSADLYCLSSRYEGMPNTLIEAMFLGIPVLATDCTSGPREILCDGEYGRLVAPGSATALAEAIEDALLDYPRWQSIVADAREHVCRRFGPEAGIARLEELLEGVVESPEIR